MKTEKRKWERLIEIVEENKVVDFVDVQLLHVHKKYWMVYALALSIAKWHPDRLLKRGDGECAVCLLIGKGSCDPCPAKMNGLKCMHSDHPFAKWGTKGLSRPDYLRETGYRDLEAQQIFEHLNIEYAKMLEITELKYVIEEQKRQLSYG